MRTTRITVLGTFAVERDGVVAPGDGWRRRQAASLVKLLALAPGRRLHREQVIDALWPDHTPDAVAPKLHKATYYARRALGDNDALVTVGDVLTLLPHDDVVVDAVAFEEAAVVALRRDDQLEMAAALDAHPGELLPDDPYEEWLLAPRERLAALRADLLRRLGRWEHLIAVDPTDEAAHLALIRSLRERGDVHGAMRQYERLERALSTELGCTPGPEASALRDQLLELGSVTAGAPADRALELVGREGALASLVALLEDAEQGRGRTAFVRGPVGAGKTALLDAVARHAGERGCLVGRGAAARVEGSWPYAPVLEALGELCRADRSLLDDLDPAYRAELDRALLGSELHWSGEGGHQRLFVAAAELLRLAGREQCVVLVLDDLHDADEASTRLLHYLARGLTDEPVLLVLAAREGAAAGPLLSVQSSLVGRGAATDVQLDRLDEERARQLVSTAAPGLDDEAAARVIAVADGSPFALVELARQAAAGAAPVDSVGEAILRALDPDDEQVLERAALLGSSFDTDEFVAVTDLPDDEAFTHLDRALAARILEHTGARYRFRHSLVREALLAGLPPHRRLEIHRLTAERLADLGASPARVGHHLLEGGDHEAAVPHLLAAADRAAAVGAYRDAYALVGRIQDHAGGEHRAQALALRADLLFALGDPTAPAAYRQALPLASGDQARLLRARLARAATVAGDIDTAVAAIDGLVPDGGPTDPDVLLARANVAYFAGDHAGAWDLTQQARTRILSGDQTWQVLDLIALEGLLAHHRGEWFDRMRTELVRTVQDPEIALAIFDSYLCPAEYLLYGPTPYEDVLQLAERLHATALRSGALRAVAFASALAGEAALLAGDLSRARRELEESMALHREIGARSGEAHSLQRLAEVELAEGNRAAARTLLQRALPLARWSTISLHLLQRIYGTMMLAADGPDAALAVIERAEATLGTEDLCPFCAVMLAVPAATASAQAGDLDRADLYLAIAEQSGALWEGTSWRAAIVEARAHRAAAAGDQEEAVALMSEARDLFEVAGQPLDTARCEHAPDASGAAVPLG
ncbi:ATP-binding protein [Salinilacustrithrix flava]|uniref:ATP-binding protein n=1 Tax=Salinilacustrithrix flava TaxID=2957203 RepID=UPI003D7C2E2D